MREKRGSLVVCVLVARVFFVPFFQLGDDHGSADGHNSGQYKRAVFDLAVDKLGGRNKIVHVCPNVEGKQRSDQKKNIFEPAAHSDLPLIDWSTSGIPVNYYLLTSNVLNSLVSGKRNGD